VFTFDFIIPSNTVLSVGKFYVFAVEADALLLPSLLTAVVVVVVEVVVAAAARG